MILPTLDLILKRVLLVGQFGLKTFLKGKYFGRNFDSCSTQSKSY
jgi:hypothetical protein